MLTDSKETSIIDKLQNLYLLLSAQFGNCTGVSPSRFRLLQQLYHADEFSQAALQKELQIDSAAITRHLKQLEADGIVARRMNPSDNRVTLVRLTDHGRKEIVLYRKEMERFLAQMLQDFSMEEQQQLSRMLARMQSNIRNYTEGE